MIDVKKLVTGFLVAAFAASAFALGISALPGKSQIASIATNIIQNDPASYSGNAFTAPYNNQTGATIITDDPSASTTDAIMGDPNNLTNILAGAYMQNLVLANPNGTNADATGNPTLNSPDNASVLEDFFTSSTKLKVDIPDWDTEAAEMPIIETSSTPDSVATYGNTLGEILNKNIVATNMQNSLQNANDLNVATNISGSIAITMKDIAGLQTPSAAVDLQKSLIKTLVYAKNELALAGNASVDPVKTELIFEAQEVKYNSAVQALQASIQKAQTNNLFSALTPKSQHGLLSILQSVAGVPVAHAQFASVVHDPINGIGIWATVAQMIKAEIKDIVLQIAKNTLVFIMQKTIIAGIQHSGAPQFIQQWGTSLANTFTQSAVNALDSKMVCVGAAPFASQLRITLGAFYKPGNNNVCAVQFQNQLGNNLSNFYNNFSDGGAWLTYGYTEQPSNDFYGSVFFTAQAVDASAQNAKTAASAKNVASQGFTGTAVCDDGSNPNGITVQCQNPSTGLITVTQKLTCPTGTKQIGAVSNAGFCMDGTEPQIQTPGTIASNMVNSALDGNFKLVTSANSWIGLASGLFISILQETLNSLAQTTITGVNGLLNQAANGGGANSVSNGSVTSGASSAQPITCYVSPDPSGNNLAAQLMASGGNSVSATGATTPLYSWITPANGRLSAITGTNVIATFNATGTYQVVVNEAPDGTTGTCDITIPVPIQ